MQSIIQPLAQKVSIFTSHISVIVRGLADGDPAAKAQIEALWKDLANFKQECSSAWASLNSSYETSISTAQASKNPTPLIRIIQYYITEVMAAINLIRDLMVLIVSLISISSLLEYITTKLLYYQQNFNTKTLWLTRALTRAKQKLSKSVEWEKRTIAAKLDIVYYTAQQKQYTETLNQLQAKLPVVPAPNPGLGGNGTYVNGVFVYFNQTTGSVAQSNSTILSTNVKNSLNSSAATPILYDVSSTKSQVEAVQNKLNTINDELKSANDELNVTIPNDKKYWTNLWKVQEDQDKHDLLNNVPVIGLK